MIEEEISKNNGYKSHDKNIIFSISARAGKRTYFFDIKPTRRNDFYLTITESKKRINNNGRFYFEKHTVFLYKEDFYKFSNALNQVFEYFGNLKTEDSSNDFDHGNDESERYNKVEFEDLESMEASGNVKTDHD